ncbi:MFS multidrug transporter-like protein [Xylariomycetidae sp. FL2044]|nr:MFS multidrug transporter-like protein [Xylariomycetidae sp. FL2044]
MASIKMFRSGGQQQHAPDEKLPKMPFLGPKKQSNLEAPFDESPSLELNSSETRSSSCRPSLLQEQEVDMKLSWDGPDDADNPLNWSGKRKWVATILVSCFAWCVSPQSFFVSPQSFFMPSLTSLAVLVSPFASTMVTPALDDIGREFAIPQGFMQALVMSIFLLGFAQGPFVLAPLSEIFGRVSVLQCANCIFLIFNTACGFAKTKEQMYAFRFLSGIGGSAPQALCSGVLADVWRPEERGKGQAIYGILTYIAPTIAPIVGAYMSAYFEWRWIFFVVSIFDILVQLAALFWLQETYAPRVLDKKAARLRKKTGNPSIRTEYDNPDKTFGAIVRRQMLLPLIMLFAHPAVQIPSIYRAVQYGIMYLVLSIFGEVWEIKYDESPTTATLNYLSLCIGFVIGLNMSHSLIDGLYLYFKKRNNTHEGVPEWRVPPMLIGGLLAPIGLFIYGWAAQYRVHWSIPNMGCVILAMGLIITFQSSQAYVVDAYGYRSAASAAAAGAFMRTMCGFSFPLFAPTLYNSLDLGWGNSLLAFLTMGLSLLCPVLWWYGERIRAGSTAGLKYI